MTVINIDGTEHDLRGMHEDAQKIADRRPGRAGWSQDQYLLHGLAISLAAVLDLVERLQKECALGAHDFPEDPETGRLLPCTVCGNPHLIAASGAPTA